MANKSFSLTHNVTVHQIFNVYITHGIDIVNNSLTPTLIRNVIFCLSMHKRYPIVELPALFDQRKL